MLKIKFKKRIRKISIKISKHINNKYYFESVTYLKFLMSGVKRMNCFKFLKSCLIIVIEYLLMGESISIREMLQVIEEWILSW